MTQKPIQSRQPAPGERLACIRESLAPRGCAVRSAQSITHMRILISLMTLSLLLMASSATESDEDVGRKLTGTWSHNIPWNDGRDRKLLLKGTQDAHGKMHFEFVRPPFSYKPIFAALNVRQGQVEIMFKMVLYSDESEVSRHSIQYVLKEKNGIWSGRLLQSWVELPVEVTLEKEK